MNAEKNWQQVAERLAENGWSWKYRNFSDRNGHSFHMAEAHDIEGVTHAVFAESVTPAFVALEQSIKAAGK
jgi:hypothetical protein